MKLFRIFTAAAVLTAGSTAFGASAYFSTVDFGGGASPGNPDIAFANLASAVATDLHIYFVPGPGDPAYLGISIGVKSITPGVANLTNPIVMNYDIVIPAAGDLDSGDNRWDPVGVPGGTVDLISNFTGVAVSQKGLDVLNDGVASGFLDQGYDATASAFYFGKVTLDPVGEGSSEYFLTVGDIGIARSGDAPQPVGPTVSLTFGDAEPTAVLGDDFGGTGTMWDARITIPVIPEPSTALLLGTGLLLGFFRRRRP